MPDTIESPIAAKEPEDAPRPAAPARAGEGWRAPAEALDLNELLNVLRRRRGLIGGATILLTILAAIVIFQLTPRYTAEALVMLDTRKTQVTDIQAVMSGLQADEAVVRSEVELIKSPALAEKVAQKLNLMSDPDFLPPESEESIWENLNPRHWLPETVLGWMGIDSTPPAMTAEQIARDRLDWAMGKLAGGLTVFNDGRSYILKIRYESEKPELAARIANAFVDVYLNAQLEAKFEATKRANDWLNEHISDLRQKVQASEHAVQLFKQQNQLTEAKGVTVGSQQLAELNSQLILATSDRAQKEAALRQAQRSAGSLGGADGDASVPQVLSSPIVQQLQGQEAVLRQQEAEMSERYKPAHPAMINVRAQLRDLRNKIQEEGRKAIQGLANEVAAARAREESLRASLQQLQQSAAQLDSKQVQLNELQREADANTSLYQNFLTRFRETSAEQDIQQADARLVSAAQLPKIPTFPRPLLFTETAFMGSLLFGVLLALVVERLDHGFRTSEQVEKLAGVPVLGLVPNIAAGRSPHEEVLARPISAYSEAIRSVRTALRFSRLDDPAKVVLVTSSLPGEGKTEFATSLARSIARSGGKALLIDCDLRHPSIGKVMGADKGPGLLSLFNEGGDISKIIVADPASGMHYIPSGGGTSNPQDLLGSARMREFINAMRGTYDLIVIDAPPILAVSDALVLSHLADTTVFLIRWERTPRTVAMGALKIFYTQGGSLAGTVISRVNVRKHARYGYGDSGYYYGNYHKYYSDKPA